MSALKEALKVLLPELAKPEWRCVRLDLYPPGTPLSAMQGHYIRADTGDKALVEMQRRFPGETILVQPWKQGLE